MLTPKEQIRYEHHLNLPGFGAEKQEKLKAASVLVVGAGGLGCPVLYYLAAAGIGKIGIVDDDEVALTNLQRQILYSTKTIGRKKVIVAAEKISELNPHLEVKTYCERLTNVNTLQILNEYDVVADCSDNMATRYMINDACVLAGKSLVSGSVFRYEGQVISLNCPTKNDGRSPDYRAVYPEVENNDASVDCNTAGVLGVVPGIVGCMQANEIIRLITADVDLFEPKLIAVNAANVGLTQLSIAGLKSSGKPGPANREAFLNWKYESDNCKTSLNMTPEELIVAMNEQPAPLLLDVRMPNEFPEAEGLKAMNIPLPLLENSLDQIGDAKKIIVFCKSGVRSEKARRILEAKFTDCTIQSLQGGVMAWNDYYEKNWLTHNNDNS